MLGGAGEAQLEVRTTARAMHRQRRADFMLRPLEETTSIVSVVRPGPNLGGPDNSDLHAGRPLFPDQGLTPAVGQRFSCRFDKYVEHHRPCDRGVAAMAPCRRLLPAAKGDGSGAARPVELGAADAAVSRHRSIIRMPGPWESMRLRLDDFPSPPCRDDRQPGRSQLGRSVAPFTVEERDGTTFIGADTRSLIRLMCSCWRRWICARRGAITTNLSVTSTSL